jgi:hypothetical protein
MEVSMLTATIPFDRVRMDAKAVELSVVASGSARLTVSKMAAIRKDSLPGLPTRLSPQLLRHSDEQTLAALVALSTAMKSISMASKSFADWAIVSSSCNLGRSAFAKVIDKYRNEGPWGVSVQVIPHCTAHAVAGTISLALESHGPCIGAGGGTDGGIEALLSAASVLRQSDWCGAWIVFSAWSPEPALDTAGQLRSDSICSAAAIAVTSQPSDCSLGRIRLEARRTPGWQQADTFENKAASASLIDFFANSSGDCYKWSSPATSEMRIDVEMSRGNWRESTQRSSVADTSRSSKPRAGRESRAILVA